MAKEWGTYYFDKIVGGFSNTFEIYISLRTNRSMVIAGFMLYQASYSILLKTVATGEGRLQSSPKRLLPLPTFYFNFLKIEVAKLIDQGPGHSLGPIPPLGRFTSS